MGHTNSTTYYNLPQFLTSDKPAWLTDINNAMSDIDSGLHAAQSDATTAGNNATQALSDASAASSAASAADAKGAGAVASIEEAFDATAVYAVGAKVMYNSLLYRCTVAITTPGPWTGSANWERITVNSIIPVDAAALPIGNTTPSGSTAAAIANKLSKNDIKLSSVTLSGSGGQYISNIDFDDVPIINAWVQGYAFLVIVRKTDTGKAAFNIYNYSTANVRFEAITFANVTINYQYIDIT